METDANQDFQDYWNEYRILQATKHLDDYLDEVDEYGPRSYEDGEQEAEWLQAAGLPHLSAPYLEGRELSDIDLDPALRQLPPHQADAVRRRVRTLNLTIKGRGQHRHHKHRKPDIRDVFRDVENSSTGTRSRSATPDSIESYLPLEETGSSSPPSLLQVFQHPHETDRLLRRTPSAPPPSLNVSVNTSANVSVNSTNYPLFRRSGHWGGLKGDIASDSGDNIRMVKYQQFGTLHLPRPKERFRSGSDPTSTANLIPPQVLKGASSINNLAPSTKKTDSKNEYHPIVTRSVSNVYNIDRRHGTDDALVQRAASRNVLRRSGSQSHLIDKDRYGNKPKVSLHGIDIRVSSHPDICRVGRSFIEYLGEADIVKLQNLLLLEVTAIFDIVNIPFHRRKPPKRKLKHESNVFGVSLSSLLENDRERLGTNSNIPFIFQKIFSHLEHYGAKEEGILRLAGSKNKVQALIADLEREMYSRPELVDQLLQQVTCHDVVDVLKRLIRDLPTPLLTYEIINMFYQTHVLQDKLIQKRALNLLVLMLPVELRDTLRALFKFLSHIIEFSRVNRMSLPNVAMIIAPSLFQADLIRVTDKTIDSQVNMAVTSCHLTETMLECEDSLWIVPEELVMQIRRSNEEERYRRRHKENSKPIKRLLGRKGAREPITRKINNEVDFQDGIIRVNAPQFQLRDEPIHLSEDTTAGDIVWRIVEEATKGSDLPPTILNDMRRSRFDMKSRALLELVPNGGLNCFLATGDAEMSLQTHYLYEIGGNIGQRQIEHSALLLAVYKDNPNAQWLLKCHHRIGHHSHSPN